MQMTDGYNTYAMEQESGQTTGDTATVNLGPMSVETHVPKLEDVGHPNVPGVDDNYIMREINGMSDLEVLSFAINDPDFFAMIEGEAATGKNFAVDTLCAAANWPRVRVNFSISSSYESLVGRFAPVDSEDSIEDETYSRAEAINRTEHRLVNEGVSDAAEKAEQAIPEAATFQWVDGLLTRAVKLGWVFVADEINAAEPEALMPFNGLTEDRNSRYLTIEELSTVIEPHDRFRLVATRNPVTYSGTVDMNSALESRAYIIPFDYHEDDALIEILKNRTNIVENESEKALEQLVDLTTDIRDSEQNNTEIVTKISTRELIKIGKMTEITNIRNATKTIFSGVADPTDEEAITEMVRTQNF